MISLKKLQAMLSVQLEQCHLTDRNKFSSHAGNITVQTGQNWSVNVFDIVKVRRKPGGGVDVDVQPPSFLSRMFPRNGSAAGGGPNTSQNIRRRGTKLIPDIE
jgi:hypothetical protein